ncbi:MAG: NAD(P)H-binding protein [Acidobacteria bacterium]|nr:NAD(P)H-binding protein [Acidobacteriota bacterium]
MNNIYVVTGATGNIGKRLAEKLLASGKIVRVIGREAAKLSSLVDKGATALIGSLEDESFLNTAFQGATYLFAMIPPNFIAEDLRAFQNRVSKALVNAVKSTNITHIVTLSSLGAHLPSGTGPILGLHDAEEQFNKLEKVNVLHLRPGFFMENLLNGINTIKSLGFNGSPQDPNIAVPMIATKDIADVAFDALSSPSFIGKSTRELYGQRDLTILEATKVLGKYIGKPDLNYIQFSFADARNAMLGLGFSASLVDAMLEMYQGINNKSLIGIEKRSSSNTTPTTIEEFAEEIFAPAYGVNQSTSANV